MEDNMNNERKNNTYGVFYGVIGVATLIVTIIGATFAYFTAVTNSTDSAITAGGANISLDYKDTSEEGITNTGLKSNLIPVASTDGNFKNFIGIGANDCQDLNGNNICSVYTFSVGNPSTNTANMEITANVTPTLNTFTNLMMAIFKGKPTEIVDGKWDVNADIPTDKPTANEQESCDLTVCDWGDLDNGTLIFKDQLDFDSTAAIDINLMQQVLKQGEYQDYTIVLWIEETGSAQNEDQGKSFTGGINFSTSAGENLGITGVLSAS